MTILTLTSESLQHEHICCAIADRKCAQGYGAKKRWLAEQHAHGYRFSRLDARGKVFIEYGPGEQAWMPVIAPGWMVMGCFWVSGQFKGQGHGRALLQTALEEARKLGRAGLVSIAARKKMHFQSDGAWLLRQGFREVDSLDNGFTLLALAADGAGIAERPQFADSARSGPGPEAKGVTVYYSNRCPFTEFHIGTSLAETCAKRGLTPTIVKLDSVEAAQSAPTPATIFSLFLDGRFVTTDLGVCMDSRFDRIVAGALRS
ncbi:GNAT family N-acetyltransferase [Frigidibacter albus]|uniref:GNAT family N-acetyltransferase n=1 Tax=Frigidibacter albus TaxID=1465486 RepID=A0A6L8VCE7_9RHOB|nr:GNAT family N-acetyltransferase [Frigidibacter albus]MZQ87904.1 GNAT family N-acetyltransferase [Frigidibacter albus]NBE29810.1 GNAT family N-acetyltransferase [Frigidibacter albus]GGH42630.1 GNAT family acetyltransferase [Frigidibacter albus]